MAVAILTDRRSSWGRLGQTGADKVSIIFYRCIVPTTALMILASSREERGSWHQEKLYFMKITPLMQKYILLWGEMRTRWGVNRMVAQIHARLYLTPDPLAAEEIANRETHWFFANRYVKSMPMFNSEKTNV